MTESMLLVRMRIRPAAIFLRTDIRFVKWTQPADTFANKDNF